MEVLSAHDSFAPEAPSTPDDSLRIILSRASDPQMCSFWVGIYKSHGKGNSKDFLEIEKLDEAFKYLSEVGLAEDQPLMHSDSTGERHRQFFLLPETYFTQDAAVGKALILDTLSALTQKKAGLYIAPALLDNASVRQTLAELTVGLAKMKCEEVYLLTADLGINQLLNVTLAVKEKLRNTREVWIFH